MKLSAPRINDITTDLDDPPRYPSGRHGAYPSRFSDKVRQHYGSLAPLRVDRPAAEVFAAARAVAERLGWRIDSADPTTGLLEAVAITRLMRFRDDIVVRLRERDGQTTVDLRSASRLGQSDFGVNAARIETFLAELRRELA